ncbi:hypothetical protein [Asanoa siamensis]|uniref:Uncharacterized protein n=1 Tax=Asanoa siamensis TaxID=926357 RepID=A0ABQ4CVE5_9ACTN|nr:hypothetical protein [Asanoa siamensis]GIF75256.1 hypothetical protein Asi02nite_47740 [Asanoa siamensis]
MRDEQSGTFRQWVEAYTALYTALPGSADVACPHCGQHRLRLVFTGWDRVGFASLWCDACHWGIWLSRARIPEGATVLDPELSETERRAIVPNYRIIPPDEDWDADDEEDDEEEDEERP